MKKIINEAYEAFKAYQVTDFSALTVFDHGPTQEELDGVSLNLKDVPDKVLGSMEFYDFGWESWGTEVEVKYFLPRFLEYLAAKPSRLEGGGASSLLKFKMLNLHESELWLPAEKAILFSFLDIFFDQIFKENKILEVAVECMLAIGMSPDSIIERLSKDPKIHNAQVVLLNDHIRSGFLFHGDSKKIEELKTILYEKTTYFETD